MDQEPTWQMYQARDPIPAYEARLTDAGILNADLVRSRGTLSARRAERAGSARASGNGGVALAPGRSG